MIAVHDTNRARRCASHAAPAWCLRVAFTCLALGACEGAPNERSRVADPQRDIPEMTVSETALLEIGVHDERPGHDLGYVIGVALLDDGAVVVADAGGQELRIFDAQGDLQTKAGRPGDGPGDLAFLAGVNGCTDGRLVARQPRRATVFSRDGAVQQVIAAPDPTAVYGQDAVGVNASCDQLLWLTRGQLPFDTTGFVQQPWFLQWTSAQDTIDVLAFPGLERFRTEVNGEPAMVAVPWMPEPSWATFDSTVVFASGVHDTLRIWHAARGWRDVAIPLTARDIRAADRAGYVAYRDAAIAMEPREARSLMALDALPSVPSVAPVVAELLGDGVSRVWIRPFPDSSSGYKEAGTPARAGGERWLTFDLDSRQMAWVRVPEGLALKDVRGNRIAGVREAEDGAQQVMVYELRAARKP
jgi:hypothetical protein